MVPDHGSQYEENPSSHHRGMHKDGLTNRQDPFPYSIVAEQGINTQCSFLFCSTNLFEVFILSV